MNLLQKNIIHIILKSISLLFLIACSPIKTFGQDFEWLYSTRGQNLSTDLVYAKVWNVITNSGNEIYAIGDHYGQHDFGDGQQEIVYSANSSVTSNFFLKLDENKNILWVNILKAGGYYRITSLALDDNGNLLVCGFIDPVNTSLYFDPKPPNPGIPNVFTPTHVNLSTEHDYGFVAKYDPQGNYLDSKLFQDIYIYDIVKDNNNDMILVGNVVEYKEHMNTEYLRKWGYITKLDNSLSTIWDKTFVNQNSDSNNGFGSVECDSQNNIYCTGSYRNSFNFSNKDLNQNSSQQDSYFICKFLPNGTENHITELFQYAVSQVQADASDNIYFLASYTESAPVQFKNTVVNDLPVVEETELVLFKTDVNGNHIWHVPIFGPDYQELNDFAINNLGELILPIKMGYNKEFYYADQNTIVTTDKSVFVLLKINPQGGLIDYKGIYENTSDGRVYSTSIAVNSDNSIILGGLIISPTDFDPNPFKEHFIYPGTYDLTVNGVTNTYFEQVAFVLKLANCDAESLFDSNYSFCFGTNPNPTIADIKPSGINVKWYATSGSLTPLNADFALTDGQTYYYENIVQNCSNIGRFPLQINILPASVPPVINTVQPCYFQSMKLSDLNIQGQNILFYSSLTASESIMSSTVIMPDVVYYVTQRLGNCESNRIPLVLSDYFESIPGEYFIRFCDTNNNRFINLSDYNHLFLAANPSESDYIFSYHNSASDANANSSPITNYQNYPVTESTIYVRVFSQVQSCFKTFILKMELLSPPVIEEIKVSELTTNNSITVLPYNENYAYSIDGVMYQNSNYFEDLSAGEYTVYIKTGTDCVGLPKKVFVLEYPKFFSPNGDGINDYWKVKYSQLQFVFDVEIYDRYGRIIDSFNKSSIGWDGKYKGKELPASDYWFRIIRVTDKETIYRGHFSLKR